MKEKYDTIGIGYNTTRKADPYLTGRWRHYLNPQPGKHYVDIGCGTGNYTVALYENGWHFTGIDPSEEMLQAARSRHGQINWLKGKAEEIPLPAESMDGAMAGLTIHHWKSIGEGFRELGRVLKKDSPLVIFTSTPAQMESYWLNHYFPLALRRSILQMPSYQHVSEHLKKAGFCIVTTEKYFIREDLEDLFLQSGKYAPSLYLDAEVRKGISTFASLAGDDEMETGLQQLTEDIRTGTIGEIIRNYEKDTGDYLFIAAEKQQ